MRRLGRITGLVLAMAAVMLATASAAPDAAQACAKANTPTKRLSKVEVRQAIRCVINHARGPNLKPDRSLKRAAQRHSRRMRISNCVSHQCPGEPDLTNRVRRSGYLNGASAYRLGEVIAGLPVRRSPRDVVRTWMASSSHRATILGSFKHFNVGITRKRRLGYYTVVFGWRS